MLNKEIINKIKNEKFPINISIEDKKSLEALNRLQMLFLKKDAIDKVLEVVIAKANTVDTTTHLQQIIDDYTSVSFEQNTIIQNILLSCLDEETYKYIIINEVHYRVDWGLSLVVIG